MKKISILVVLCTLLSQGLISQDIGQSVSMSEEVKKERLEDIDKENSKLEKKIKKSDKIISRSEEEVRESENELKYNEKQQIEFLEKIADVKNSMNGYDLAALDDKIKRLNKERKSYENENERFERLITKKTAEIERLKAEIANMEDDIYKNNRLIDERQGDINSTENIITKNGLEDKNDRLEDYEKEYDSLKREEKKITDHLSKLERSIEKEKNNRKENSERRTQLESERLRLTTSESTSSISTE